MASAATIASPAEPTSRARSDPLPWTLAILGILLLLQLPMVVGRAINWDEFFHYSQIGRLASGTLTEPLQTLYTRAFLWVLNLPGTGVDHIIVIRVFMLACELVTIAAIVGIAERFTDRVTGLLCAIAYVSTAYVFKHGTSFRFDPPAAALLMSAAWLLLRYRLDLRTIAAVATLVGISTILTIKTVLFAPVFAGVTWLCWSEGGRRQEDIGRWALLAFWTLATAGAVYVLHSLTLAANSAHEARQIIGSSSAKMFGGNLLYGRDAVIAVVTAPVVALAIVAAPFVIWRGEQPVAEKVALTGLWLPVTTLLFYHNTAPYYYAYMLPPVLVAAAPIFAHVSRRYSPIAIGAVLASFVAVTLYFEPENPIDKQREVQNAAEDMFPEGVAYFDSYAMLGAWPKANVFMTPWGIHRYLNGEMASMVDAMAQRPVPLLVNNDAFLDGAVRFDRRVPAFLPADQLALRETYIPAWGPFWLAGKQLPPRSEGVSWHVRVPGTYTVRQGTLTINGRRHVEGAAVTLVRGRYLLSTGDRPVTLMWGDRIQLPASSPPDHPYVMPF